MRRNIRGERVLESRLLVQQPEADLPSGVQLMSDYLDGFEKDHRYTNMEMAAWALLGATGSRIPEPLQQLAERIAQAVEYGRQEQKQCGIANATQ